MKCGVISRKGNAMTDPNYNQQTGYQAQQPYQGQQPGYQQPYQQPYQPAPVGPEMPGSHKAAWFFIGMFTGIAGILIASMVNVDKPYRSDGTKWAVIGCFFWLAVCIFIIVGGCSASVVTQSIGSY